MVFQNSVLDGALTVRDNLVSRAALYGITGKAAAARIDELAGLLDFGNIVNRTLGKLSGGQRRRIDVARALIHRPKILILDEPTTGLDPQTRKTLWEVIGECRRRDGMTVFLTTHYMEEAADADYVVILDAGKIVAKGTPLELKNAYTGDFITVYNPDNEAVGRLGLPVENIRDAVRIAVKNTAEARDLIVAHPELFSDSRSRKARWTTCSLPLRAKNLREGIENAYFSAIVRRNVKMFFKDKGMFFTSLITPIILLVLYATFLARIYRDSFVSALPDGLAIDEKLISATVGGQLMSSLLAVSCVTVSFCANLLSVQDRVSGARKDMLVTPVRRSTIAGAYYVGTLATTVIVSLVATAACFVYLAINGWYLSFGDVALIILDVVILTMFGTALASVVNAFLTSNGQASAVGTIVSAGYGFICGALGNVMMFLPGTYGTSLIRNHCLGGVYREMSSIGFPWGRGGNKGQRGLQHILFR